MQAENISFKQCSNAFLKCSNPNRLQELADSLTAHDLLCNGSRLLPSCRAVFLRLSPLGAEGYATV